MIEGDAERLTGLRKLLTEGKRTEASKRASMYARHRQDSPDFLAEVINALAEHLASFGDAHRARGRPRKNDGTRWMVLSGMLARYYNLLTAADAVDGREVAPADGARLLWWAFVGDRWWQACKEGKAKLTHEQAFANLKAMLSNPEHEHHAYYSSILPEVGAIVLEEEGLHRVERQHLRAAARHAVHKQGGRLVGITHSMLERAIAAEGRRRKKRT